MVFHIVLFRPKPGVTDFDRQAMFEALKAAASGIPAVRRFHVGSRITHGGQYEQMMREDYHYAAVVEFDDLAGLQAYLRHAQHATLGALFYALLESGLVYDYQVESVS